MLYNRTLINPKNNKTWTSAIEGTTLTTIAGKRKTSKEYAALEVTQKEAAKKIWAKLKAGFIYRNENAQQGEALLQFYFNEKYSGFFGFDYYSTKQQLVLSKPPVRNEKTGEVWLVDINPFEIQWKKKLISFDFYQLAFVEDGVSFLGLIDTKVYLFDTVSGAEKLLAKGNYKSEIPFCYANHILIAQDGNDYAVFDIQNDKRLFSIPLQSLTNPINAAISPDGNLAAFLLGDHQLVLWNIKAQQQLEVIATEVRHLNNLTFHSNGEELLYNIYEQGKYALKSYNLNTKTSEIKRFEATFSYPTGKTFTKSAGHTYTLSPNGEYIAIKNTTGINKAVAILDYNTGDVIVKIPLEYVVKRCEVLFSKDGSLLIVRTDYGLISIYNLK